MLVFANKFFYPKDFRFREHFRFRKQIFIYRKKLLLSFIKIIFHKFSSSRSFLTIFYVNIFFITFFKLFQRKAKNFARKYENEKKLVQSYHQHQFHHQNFFLTYEQVPCSSTSSSFELTPMELPWMAKLWSRSSVIGYGQQAATWLFRHCNDQLTILRVKTHKFSDD
jgi:hypothetical protein